MAGPHAAGDSGAARRPSTDGPRRPVAVAPPGVARFPALAGDITAAAVPGVRAGRRLAAVVVVAAAVAITIPRVARGDGADTIGADARPVRRLAGPAARTALRDVRTRIDFTARGVFAIAIPIANGAIDATSACGARRHPVAHCPTGGVTCAAVRDVGIRFDFAAICGVPIAIRVPDIAAQYLARATQTGRRGVR